MYEYHVKKVISIVDGDTLDLDIDLGFNVSFAQRVRMAGIDSPESRTTNKVEKALGLEAKQYLSDQLKNAKNIIVKTEKLDSSEKYGRILGWLFIDGQEISVNQKMIDSGYAWPYLGDTKVKDFDALIQKRKRNVT